MSSTAPAKPASSGYDVSKPLGRCHVSEAIIAPGDKFMAALRETASGFDRVDVSLDAWESFERTNLLAFWQAVMPRADERKRLFVDDNILCELFERLSDVTEPAKLNFRFVLGLILMRKKLLAYETSRVEDGREIWTMRVKGKDARMDLLNPRLTEDQMKDVSGQLGEILNEEL